MFQQLQDHLLVLPNAAEDIPVQAEIRIISNSNTFSPENCWRKKKKETTQGTMDFKS